MRRDYVRGMRAPTAVLIAAVALCAGCGSNEDSEALPQGSEPVELAPADFTLEIDHPFWPMSPGDSWVYEESDQEGGKLRVEVTVTSRTKRIMGIEARVVHDIVTEDGDVVEDTLDWYAQDERGNLWYLGENTKEYDHGKVSTKGSWQAGVDGAQAGIILPAQPEVGMTYRQEYYAGEAEDRAEILSLDERVTVPYGAFDHVLKTADSTPLEPELVENKFYARGVGPVLAVTVSGGSDREELVRFTAGP
jgi:hypothetical protein